MMVNVAGKYLTGLMMRHSSNSNQIVTKLDGSMRRYKSSHVLDTLTFSVGNNKTGEFSRGLSFIDKIKNTIVYENYIQGIKNLVSHIKKDVFKL